jgi:hypothetical protein
VCNIVKKCDECGKEKECVITCTYPSDDSTTDLCPDCLKKDGSFCLSCGQFCAGMTSFDFNHPGYCDTCWDEIENSIRWDEEEEECEAHDEYYNAVYEDDEDDYNPNFPFENEEEDE